MIQISAYIPCYNNASTIGKVIESIKKQTLPIEELFVIDDDSTDSSAEVARSAGVRVIRHLKNLGRGAVRARAMEEARHEFVFCCDATNIVESDFLAKALAWFKDLKVAAVYGRITQESPQNAVDRWRGIHLFKERVKFSVRHQSLLITCAMVVRKFAVIEVGNYDPSLRHTEDADLGERLRRAGYDIIFDPTLKATSIARDSLGKTLERYWRWYAGKDEIISWKGYVKQIIFSIKVMAWDDLRDKDPLRALISLYCPHYQFWKSFTRCLKKTNAAKNLKRISFLHLYLEGRKEECAQGLYPKNHLWGIDALGKAGWQVNHIKTDDDSLLCRIGKKLTAWTGGRFGDLHAEFLLLRQLKQTDIIYAASGNLFLLPLLRSLRLIKAKIVIWIFRPPHKAPFWKLRNLQHSWLVRRGYDGILCLTKKGESYYRNKYPRALVKAVIWGADLDLFKPVSNTKEKFFFAVGKIWRDYKTLIQALAQVNYPCKIIAPEELFKGLNIPPHVEITKGSKEPPDAAISYPELRQWYACSKAVLIPLALDDPNDTCGFTNLLEAMAMGKPIIMTRSGCLDIDIEVLGIGFYVRPYDVDGWVGALKFILENPQKAAKMGQKARKLAEDYYNVDRFGNDLRGYFNDLVERK